MKKVSRRQLMGAAAASALAARAPAQAPAPPNANFAQAAEESHRRNSMILASFPIPMSVEPAFQFKA
jgi:hypothetical protein